MNQRPSFIIHKDSLSVLDELSDEQAGQLFKAIKKYHDGEDLMLDPFMKICFLPFKNQFNRDQDKYQVIVNQRREAGAKGGKQKQANATKSKQTVANVADNDSVSDSDNKNKKKK